MKDLSPLTQFTGEKICYVFNKTESRFVNEKLWFSKPTDLAVHVDIRNRFTGVKREMPTFALYIYDWIIQWSNAYERNMTVPKNSSIKEFDMARGLFRKLWPNAYMDLLD